MHLAPTRPPAMQRLQTHPVKLALTTREAAAAVTLSPSGLANLVAAGRFPPPRRIGQSRVVFLPGEIEAWLDALPVAEIHEVKK